MQSRRLRLLDKIPPSLELNLPIAEQDNRLVWQEGRVDIVPTRLSQGAFSSEHADPRIDFVFSQADWSGGAGEVYFTPGSNKYAQSDGVDARWTGVAALGPKIAELSVGAMQAYIPNGAMEFGASGWTKGDLIYSGNVVENTTTVWKGAYSIRGQRLTGWDGAITVISSVPTVPSGTLNEWLGKTVTVSGVLRHNKASSISLGLGLDFGVASSRTLLNMPSDTWNTITHTDTVPANAYKVQIEVTASGLSGDSYFVYLDSVTISISGGNITPPATTPANMVYYQGKVWSIWGNVVAWWDAANQVWVPSLSTYNDSFKSLQVFNTYLVVSSSTGRFAYYDGTDWYGSTRTGNDQKATYFAIARTGTGQTVLWRSYENQVSNTSDPANGGPAWTTPYDVGDSSSAITGLYGYQGTLVVTKEDGVYQFEQFMPNQSDTVDRSGFRNITRDYATNPQTNNFAGGVEWRGALYLPVVPTGLLRIRSNAIEDISALFHAPRISKMGARVEGLAADPNNLWVILKETSTTRRLCVIREFESEIVFHTIASLTLDSVDVFTIVQGIGYVLGTRNGAGVQYTFKIPTDSIAPFADTVPDIASTGTLDTSIFLGSTLELKAPLTIDLWTQDVSAQRPITVYYGLDGAPPSTLLGQVTTSPVQTLVFPQITGRTIQLRFELATNDTISPKLYGFSLHQVLRPIRLRTWTVGVDIGQAVINERGRIIHLSPAEIIDKLYMLEDQKAPLWLAYDIDFDNEEELVPCFIRIQRDKLSSYERITLVLNEARQA